MLKEVIGNLGYQQITSLSSAASLTIPDPADNVGPVLAMLQAESQNIRYRDDGTDPTASVGMILYAGADPMPYDGNLKALRFIEVTASAKLNVSYYK